MSIGVICSTDQSAMSPFLKTEYTSRDVIGQYIYLYCMHIMTERSKMNERLPVTTPNGMFLYVSVSTVTRGQDSTSLFPKLRKNCVVSFSYYFQFNYTIIRYILSHNDPLYTKQSLKQIHLQFTNVYI